MKNDKEFESLIKLIEQMPAMAPPKNLTDRVMDSLSPKRLPFWKRVYRKAFTPTTVSFTPVKLIPSLAAVMALVFIFLIQLDDMGPTHQERQAALNSKFVPVTFALDASDAEAVSVIGSFNNWEPDRDEMHLNTKKNQWTITVLLPPGQYEYAFLINGEKVVSDPKALFTRSDGFCSRNSVVFTGNHSEL